MNLRILEYLITVAELGHFTKAAKKCYVSQPTLSTQLKKLEDQLGVVIFERDNKNVMLTQAGIKIVNQAKQVLLEAKELTMIAKNSANPLSGKFKLGIIPTIGPYIIPDVLKLVKKELSNIKLIIVEDVVENLVQDLRSGELDAVVVSSPTRCIKGIDFKTIKDEALYVAVNEDHALAQKKKITPSELLKEQLISLDESHCLRKIMTNIFDESHISKDFKASNLTTLIHLVAQNQGITILPKMALVDCPKTIKTIPLDCDDNVRTIKIGARSLNSRIDALEGNKSLLKNIC